MEFDGQRVVVLGLGVSGRSAVHFLAERGARVVAADERPPDAIDGLEGLPGHVELRVGEAFPELADFDLVVPSPGVPRARYADRARQESGDSSSASTFSLDFVAAYAYSNFANGGYAGWFGNGVSALKSRSRQKMIVGYPGGTPGYYLERTGPFRAPYQASWSRYVTVYSHSPTDLSGNSGGPVFAYHGGFGSWIVAGIHVSGGRGPIRQGAMGLDSAAHDVIDAAIGDASPLTAAPDAPASGTFRHEEPVPVPDADSAWTTVPIEVSGLGSRIEKVLVDVDVSHPSPSDLQIWLRSPHGRWIELHDGAAGNGTGVTIAGHDVSGSVRDLDPAGTWQVFVRDLVSGNTGTLRSAGLTIGAP